MIVGGVKRWHMPVPLAEVASALEIDFVVFPHPDDSRCLLDDVGRLAKRGDANLMQPLAGWIGALILVEPIAVKDCKINLVAHLPVERIEHR